MTKLASGQRRLFGAVPLLWLFAACSGMNDFDPRASGGWKSIGGASHLSMGGHRELDAGASNGGAPDAPGSAGETSGGAANCTGAAGSSGGTHAEAGAPLEESGGAAGMGGSAISATGGTSGATSGGEAGMSGDAGTGAGAASEGGAPPASGVSVVMRSYDLNRTGANTQERQLTPSVFTDGNGFGKLYCRPVDDQIYGQLLYVSNLDFGAKGRHNVVYAVTMNDSVYAYDADVAQGDPLFHVSYVDPAHDVTAIPTADLGGEVCPIYKDVAHQVGITSTPVIDLATSTMYLVTVSKESDRYLHRLHAISLIDGSERPHSPVEISASVPGDGDGSVDGQVSFDPQRNHQRSALLLYGGVVYIGFASHCDARPYHGWLLGYDAQSLQQRVALNTTPTGYQGGIWMAGQAPAVDEQGNIYLITGNGSANLDADGPNRGESFLKLQPDESGLTQLDWFTPANYQTLEWEDRDLGSSGAVLIPGTDMVLGGNKDGVIYVLDRNNFGKFQAGHDSQIRQTVYVTGTRRSHIHGSPVYWDTADGPFLYVMGEEDHLKQYQISDGQLSLYRSSIITAPTVPDAPSGYTMPGGILSLSADGDRAGSGIVWVNIPIDRDANQATVPGVLRAFNADDVTQELWNSELDPADSFGNFAKFNLPTIANGRVYQPTFSGQFCVYGAK